jgi:SlyX protein
MGTEQDRRDRIEGLETRIAFQDQTIDDLSTAVTDLWKEIATLTRKIEQLSEELAGIRAAGAELPEPPPPHY